MRSSLVTVLLASAVLGPLTTPLCAQGAAAPPAAPARPSVPPPAAPSTPVQPSAPGTPTAPVPPVARPAEGAAPSAANLPSAKSLHDKFIAAVGGEARFRKNTSRKSAIKFAMAGMSSMEADMVLLQKAPNRLLMMVELPGMGQVRQGFDGTTGWASDPMQGPRLLEGEELVQLQREAEFLRELKMFDVYKKVETVGEEKFNEVDCWKVALTDEDGDVEHAFFDKSSGLLQGLSGTMKSPAGNIPTQTVFKEYKDFDGLKMASRTEMSFMGNTQTLTLEKVEFDVVDDAMLAPPDEIKALVKAAEAAKGAAPAAPGAPSAPTAPATPTAPTAPARPAAPPATPPASK